MDVGSRECTGLRGWGLEGQGTRAVRLLGAADLRAPWEVLTRPTPTLAAAVCGARGTLLGARQAEQSPLWPTALPGPPACLGLGVGCVFMWHRCGAFVLYPCVRSVDFFHRASVQDTAHTINMNACSLSGW